MLQYLSRGKDRKTLPRSGSVQQNHPADFPHPPLTFTLGEAMADVFISYASEDREKASKMAGALSGRGWSVCWDRKIVAGQSFDQVIERELETAKSVVVLWSKNSISSEWVKNEAAVAAERGVLVPALIDPVKIPLEFRRKQTVDLVGWGGNFSHTGLQSLYEGISSAIGGIAQPQPIAEPSGKVRWNRRWTFAIASVMIVAVGLTVYWMIARQEPPAPTPASPVQKQSSFRDDLFQELSKDQVTALEMFAHGNPEGIALIDKNLTRIDKAVASFPDDANFHSLMGYTLKDMYQTSKGLLPTEKRQEYLSRAQKSFEQALRLDPNNAGANNGMGNVLFFEGKFDEAIKEHDIALRLTGGKYSYAEQDKKLAIRVKNGEIPFDF
jgi:hypothetical protein